MGAGIAAVGFDIVSWGTVGKIAASWVISPVLGGIIAALFLYFIKKKIIFIDERRDAAQRIVPLLVSLMATTFVTYLVIKGLKQVWSPLVELLTFLPQTKKPSPSFALSVGVCGGIVIYFITRISVGKKVESLSNSREDINTLFTIPLIFAAAILSFAHGANDVANSIGPLGVPP